MYFKNKIENYKLGKFDFLVDKMLFFFKIIFQLNLFSYVFLFIFTILFYLFKKDNYEHSFLYFTTTIVFYGAFYFSIFIAFPALVLLLVFYYLEKNIRNRKIAIKKHIFFICYSLLLLILFITIGFIIITQLH
jgi:hypothetical protein